MPGSRAPGSLLTGHGPRVSYGSASPWDTSAGRDQGRAEAGEGWGRGRPLCLSLSELALPAIPQAGTPGTPTLTASVPGGHARPSGAMLGSRAGLEGGTAAGIPRTTPASWCPGCSVRGRLTSC